MSAMHHNIELNSESSANKKLSRLPDAILEEILSFLDISSKKSFALTCKKFNQIFGYPDNMKTIVLHCKQHQRDESRDIKRRYVHVIEGSKSPIPTKIWAKLGSITSYEHEAVRVIINQGEFELSRRIYERVRETVKGDEGYDATISSSHLLSMLPNFRNLTSLEMPWIHLTRTETAKLDRIKLDMVNMKRLRVLKMDLRMFTLLNDRCMEFSSKNLKVLHLTEQGQEELNGEKFDIEAMRTLITSQSNLQDLSLQTSGSQMRKLFEKPLIVAGELKSLKISSNSNKIDFTATQQDHICDLVFDHVKTLEKLRIFSMAGRVENSKKMQHLMKTTRHELPLVERRISVLDLDEGTAACDDEYYSLSNLVQQKRPNLAMKHVTFWLNIGRPRSEFFDFISRIYPNLRSLEYQHMGTSPIFSLRSTDAIYKLNGLQHLESLVLYFQEFENLPRVSIPSLKKLKFMLIISPSSRPLLWTNMTKENVIGFLQQQMNIEELELEMEIFVPHDDMFNRVMFDFHTIIRNTLDQLGSLKKFTVYMSVFVSMLKEESLFSEWHKGQSILIMVAMEKFAQRGCEFVCLSRRNDPKKMRKLLKMTDGRVVEFK